MTSALLEDVQFRIALAGPCGVGKSTLASMLAGSYGAAVVGEAKAPMDIEVEGLPSARNVECFQRLMTNYRQEQAMRNSCARVLLFDRTLEEDREVFFKMYYRLGCIDAVQMDRLTRFSNEAERCIGSPNVTIILTAPPDVLQSRLEQAPLRRPQWLVKHIGLQCKLYSEWIANKRKPALVIDTSASDSVTMCVRAKQYLDKMVVTKSLER